MSKTLFTEGLRKFTNGLILYDYKNFFLYSDGVMSK